jgi:GGDEF domain-containing protein
VHARGDHGGHAAAGHDRRGPVGAGARQPADHAHARERAEAIRKATAELVVHYRAGTLPPATVSIGVATYPEHGDTPEALLRMADQALYRAKQLGRNVVASAGDLARTANAQAVPATT